MRLFSTGKYILSSDQIANWIIDCRALSEYDWEALSKMAMEIWDFKFCNAHGVYRGGLNFGKAMMKHYDMKHLGKVLVCDDVYTTGKSIALKRRTLLETFPNLEIQGVVAFARVKPKEDWVHAIWTMGG